MNQSPTSNKRGAPGKPAISSPDHKRSLNTHVPVAAEKATDGATDTADKLYVQSINLSSSGIDLDPIKNYLENCEQKFLSSMLYNSVEEKKFEDTSQRLSEYRAIVDDQLFQLCEDLVGKISDSDENMSYSLVRNDCTHIKYSTGGFFKTHEDYLSLTSNYIEEYTLVVCVTPEDMAEKTSGGRTIIHWGSESSTAYDATMKPGKALLFRKDLRHEGELVSSGEKHILSLNLWGIRQKNSGQVLLVEFPTANHDSSSAELTAKQIFDLSMTDKSYAIAVENVTGMLATHVEFCNRQATQASSSRESQIVKYQCTNATYDQFGTVFRVMTRQHVTEDEIIENESLLDFFGPFAVAGGKILVDLAADAADAADAAEVTEETLSGLRFSLGTTVVCNMGGNWASGTIVQLHFTNGHDGHIVPYQIKLDDGRLIFAPFDDDRVIRRGQKKNVPMLSSSPSSSSPPSIASGGQKKDGNQDNTVGKFDEDVIVCESQERAIVVADIAKKLDLPFVGFKMILIEGDYIYGDGGGNDESSPVGLTIAWLSFGDYDNIFTCSKLPGMVIDCGRATTLQGIMDHIHKDETDWGSKKSTPEGIAKLQAAQPDDCLFIDQESGMHFKTLQIASPDTSRAMRACVGIGRATYGGMGQYGGEDKEYDPLAISGQVIYLPGSTADCEDQKNFKDKKDKKDDEEDEEDVEEEKSLNSLYHMDEDGMTCFSKGEAERASLYLISIGFYQRVKQSIQSMRFELPQQSTNSVTKAQFCNESVYGKLNVLQVSGVVRMDAVKLTEKERSEMDAVKLTAWPTEEQRQGTGDLNDWSDY